MPFDMPPSFDAPPILLDRGSWEALLGERQDRIEGRLAPLRWFGLLDKLSLTRSGQPARRWSPYDLALMRGQLVVCQPSSAAIATAIMGRPLTYLCWGVPDYSGAKSFLFTTLLTRATHLLVNEEATRCEIQKLMGRTASLAPFFVDTDFFTYSGPEDRGDFIFCSGSNNRDPELLAGLAEIGHEVVWLCNDLALHKAFVSRHPRLRLCTRITYDELRRLYQTCAVAITPVVSDTHAAGQTTALEALSCGSPLLISQCRAASIFAGLPSVENVGTSDPRQWAIQIEQLTHGNRIAADATRTSAEMICDRHSAAAVSEVLSSLISRPSHDQN